VSGRPYSGGNFDLSGADSPVVTVGPLRIVPVGREARLYFGPAPLERGSSEKVAAEAIRALAEHTGITAIVDLNADGMERKAAEEERLAYCGICVEDDGNALAPSILEATSRAVGELLDAGHRVYLHCTFGRGRSPTIAAAYLIAHRGMSASAARAWIEELDAKWLHRGIWTDYDARFPGRLEEFERWVRGGESS